MENAIGLLKNRFRRILNFTEQMNLNLLVNITYSACVLHIICLSQNDSFDNPSEDDEYIHSPELEEPVPAISGNRHQLLFQELQQNNLI